MLRAVDALPQLRRAADFGPSWHERRLEACTARVVRILVGVHLHAAIARLLDAGDECLRQSPARRAQRFHVRDDSREPRLVGDANHFLDRRDDADVVVRFVADVALVDAAELGGHLRERDHFFELRVASGRVVQA